METKFNFNSQICISREQSERLLVLGLKKETADMTYRMTGKVVDMGEVRWMYQHNPSVVYKGMMCKEDIPAWSLHRLFQIYLDGVISSSWNMAVFNWDDLIDCIESRIKKGYLNKEYLV